MSEIQIAFLCIQYGLAFTFVWTGVLIFKDLKTWASIIEKSWIGKWWPFPAESSMQATALYDIAVGVWLFIGVPLWIPALLAAIHLVLVLVVSGIMSPSYRDVGLLAMAVALVLYGM
jgi:hypothetical protein